MSSGKKQLLVLQQVTHEHLGTLYPIFKSNDIQINVVDFQKTPSHVPTLENIDFLVILGGPMNVDEFEKYPFLKSEIELITEAVERNIPILGICLGAQLIAKALGAKVYKNKYKEIGWHQIDFQDECLTDPLFKHFDRSETVFQWHGDTFDIPHGAINLARSEESENQCFRYKDNVYAIQFHTEVDSQVINEWLDITENICEIELENGKVEISAIRNGLTNYETRLKELNGLIANEFLNL